MNRATYLVLTVVIWALTGCGHEDTLETMDYPLTVTLSAESGLIASTGEVLDSPDYLSCDLVTYSSNTIKLATGCPERPTDCHPMYICREEQGAKPTHFDRIEDVCNGLAEGLTQPAIPNAEEGMGFVVQMNSGEGLMKFLVKSVSGSGTQASVTLEFMPVP